MRCLHLFGMLISQDSCFCPEMSIVGVFCIKSDVLIPIMQCAVKQSETSQNEMCRQQVLKIVKSDGEVIFVLFLSVFLQRHFEGQNDAERVAANLNPTKHNIMERTNRMISREDAAGLLRVTPQTISNYIKSGVLQGHIINNRLFVDADTIAAITDSVEDMEAAKQHIATLKEELARCESELESRVRDCRESIGLCGDNSNEITKSFVYSVLRSYKGVLTDNEYAVLKDMLHDGKAGRVAAQHEMTTRMAMDVCRRACGRIGREDVGLLHEENDRLKLENFRLQRIIARNNPVLDERLDTHDFSVRVLTIFKEVGAVTLRDLVRHHKSELMKTRVPSKKAMAEIEDFVKCKGLEFGMAV